MVYRVSITDHADPVSTVTTLRGTHFLRIPSQLMPTPKRKRVAVSVRVNLDLAERVKMAVKDAAGRPLYLSMSTFTEAAFEAHLIVITRQLERSEHARDLTSRNHQPNR